MDGHQLYNNLKTINRQKSFRPDYSHIHDTPLGYHEKPGWFARCLNHSMFYVRTRAEYREFMKKRRAADLTGGSSKGPKEPARLSDIPRHASETFRHHITSLASIAQGGNARVVLSSFASLHDPGLNWSDPAHISSLLSAIQKTELFSLKHFTPGLTLEGIFTGFRRYNRLLKAIARRHHTGFVDNALRIPHEDTYFIDRVHFSRKGARRMAENFFPAVLAALKTGPQK